MGSSSRSEEDPFGEALLRGGVVCWEQDGRLGSGECRDAVQGVDRDSLVTCLTVNDALAEEVLVVGGVAGEEVRHPGGADDD